MWRVWWTYCLMIFIEKDSIRPIIFIHIQKLIITIIRYRSLHCRRLRVGVGDWAIYSGKSCVSRSSFCENCVGIKGASRKDSSTSYKNICISSVQFSRSVVSDSLWPHESQHARPPRPSPTPKVHSDSRPPSQWFHPAISSWVVPFFSCPQSLPASESFPMSQLFTWGGQSTGASALASFLPKKSQSWLPSEWTGWISLQSKRLSRAFSNTTVQKHQFFGAPPSSQSNSHIHTWLLEKP